MHTRKYILHIFTILAFSSCTSKEEKAQNIVNQWLGKEVKFPTTINTQQDSIWNLMINKELKLLTVIDTNNCTECRLRLYDWEKYIKDTDTINPNVTFLFIVHAKDYAIVDLMRKKNKFTCPIFYDYKNKVGLLNKFPKNSRFQTFLLDKNNKVILLGNPIGNHHMWKLYKQAFTGEIDISQ